MYGPITRFSALPRIRTYDDAVRAVNNTKPLASGAYKGVIPAGKRRDALTLFWASSPPKLPIPSDVDPRTVWAGYTPPLQLPILPGVLAVNPEFTADNKDRFAIVSGPPSKPFMFVVWGQVCAEPVRPGWDTHMKEGTPTERQRLLGWFGMDAKNYDSRFWLTHPVTTVEVVIPSHRLGYTLMSSQTAAADGCATFADVAFLSNALRTYGVQVTREAGRLVMRGLEPFSPDSVTTDRGCFKDSMLLPAVGVVRFAVAPSGKLLPLNPVTEYIYSVNRTAYTAMSKRYGGFLKFMKIMNGIRGRQAELMPTHPWVHNMSKDVDNERNNTVTVLPVTLAELLLYFPKAARSVGVDVSVDALAGGADEAFLPNHGWLTHFASHVLKPACNRVVLLRKVAAFRQGVLPLEYTLVFSDELPRPRSTVPCPPRSGSYRESLPASEHRAADSHKFYPGRALSDGAKHLKEGHAQQLLWRRWAKWFLDPLCDSGYVRGRKGRAEFSEAQHTLFMQRYMTLLLAAPLQVLNPAANAVLFDTPQTKGVKDSRYAGGCIVVDAPNAMYLNDEVLLASADGVHALFMAILNGYHSDELYERIPIDPQFNVHDLHRHVRAQYVKTAFQHLTAEAKRHPVQIPSY